MSTRPQTITTLTNTTFTKVVSAAPRYNKAGKRIGRKWARRRIQNEAAAVDFVRKKTTFPVPKLLEVGKGGARFILASGAH
jgi:hypothetical protein